MTLQILHNGEMLWHIQCLIKHHNISKDVSKEMNELEDFFHSVAKPHVTAAAMHYFDMQEKTEKPTKHAWPHLLSMTQSMAPHQQYLSTTKNSVMLSMKEMENKCLLYGSYCCYISELLGISTTQQRALD